MDYKGTLKVAQARLDALQAEYAAEELKLSRVGQEIKGVAQVISALAPLAGEKPTFNEVITELLQTVQQSEVLEVGITERVKQLLSGAPAVVFLPVTVRNQLESVKYDLSKHSNAMATIHGVLKRLAEQQYVVAVQTPDGKTGYRWNPAAPKQ